MSDRLRVPMKLFWLLQNDLRRELRSRQVATRMLLLGCTVCFLLSYQAGVAPQQLERLAAGLCWMTFAFVAMFMLGTSIQKEKEQGGWDALQAFPVPACVVYFSKLIFHSIMLAIGQLVICPLFAVTCDANWWHSPLRLVLVLLLGNLGINAAGTLVAALASGVDRNDNLLSVLLLPLLAPVLVAASEAMWLTGPDGTTYEWTRWVQLLAAFVIVYLTIGWMLFDYVVET